MGVVKPLKIESGLRFQDSESLWVGGWSLVEFLHNMYHANGLYCSSKLVSY